MRSDAPIQALLFDTFGTTVDWRGSLIGHLQQIGAEHGYSADWAKMADTWRAKYKPAIQSVNEGKRPWTNFDRLHRETLDELLPEFGLKKVKDAERDEMVRGWERLWGWADTVPGLSRLKQKFIIGSLSNGNVRQLTNMAKHASLPWDVVFGGDLFHRYKPAPEVYDGAVALLACPASAVVMVAAHNNDLQAARSRGMKTAFVRRATEDPAPKEKWDFVAGDFQELAVQLGA